MRTTRRYQGFTLIEILMVVAVFSIAVLLSVNVFLGATRVQRREQADQRVQADARFTIESLARELRGSSVDFPLYADLNEDGTPTTGGPILDVVDLANETTILALEDSDGNQTTFRRSSLNVADPWRGDGDALEVCTSGCQVDSNWADITPTGQLLCDFRVLVSPAVDPFTLVGTCSNDPATSCTSSTICGVGKTCEDAEFPVNLQPHATVSLALADRSQDCGTVEEQRYQLTMASRLYFR